MTSRAFGGLAVVVIVVAAVVGVAIGAATAPDGTDPGAAPVTSAPVSTPGTTAPPTQASSLTIELTAPESAAANNRFELTGTVSGGAGGEQLQVQRRLDEGEWEAFPEDEPIVTEPEEDGTFSIGIETARVGANGFRIATADANGQPVFSNEVTVQIG
jgi:hypothetical protein